MVRTMEISEEATGSAVVLKTRGRLDISTAGSFEQKVLVHVYSGAPIVVVDLSAVDYVSSAGLSSVLVAAKRAKAVHCRFSLCGLAGNVLKVFEISGFAKIIPIHSGPEEAIKG